MKRYSWIAALLLTLALGVSLVGCGGEVPPGPWALTENWNGEFGGLLAQDGNATAEKQADGSIKCSGGSNSWSGLTLKPALFTLVGSAPYKLSVKGKMVGDGALKLGGASDPWPNAPGAGAKTGFKEEDDTFSLSTTVDATLAGLGVRIAGDDMNTPAFIVTQIKISEVPAE